MDWTARLGCPRKYSIAPATKRPIEREAAEVKHADWYIPKLNIISSPESYERNRFYFDRRRKEAGSPEIFFADIFFFQFTNEWWLVEPRLFRHTDWQVTCSSPTQKQYSLQKSRRHEVLELVYNPWCTGHIPLRYGKSSARSQALGRSWQTAGWLSSCELMSDQYHK